ncbi:MAG TPA: riboflavin synthase [Legionellales bacterium]|jgi:riboflavin synthase|nr:riboflavin synthase [Legionellales bacterium]
MFTGLVDALGEVIEFRRQPKSASLTIKFPYTSVVLGESIAVNGVCLTVMQARRDELSFDVSSETLAITNLGQLQVGDTVNGERALQANARLGGHWVTGHVDTITRVISLESLDEYVKLVIGPFSESQRFYLIKKGSITVDGVSLTINELSEDQIELMLVPHTIQNTCFSKIKLGQVLNIEFDYMTRTIAHQLKMMLNDAHFKKFLTQD